MNKAWLAIGTREPSPVKQLVIARQNNTQSEYSSRSAGTAGSDLQDMGPHGTISLDDREFGNYGKRETEI